ncbi:Mu transposase C-terminal domain-containing protein [Dysosmobacter sp.]
MAFTERAIRFQVENGKLGRKGTAYRYKKGSKGRGGKQLQIALEALPEQVQVAYRKQQGETIPFRNEAIYNQAQRAEAERRMDAVILFESYRADRLKDGAAKETEIKGDFVCKYNMEHPGHTITTKTLYEWIRKANSGDPQALIDGRGGYNRGSSSIDPDMWAYFQALFCKPSQPSIKECYRLTKIEADRRGITIPGEKAFRIAVDKMSAADLTLARHGKKVFEDRYMPYIERDYSTLKPNDQWVSDHHVWDVFVRVPDGRGGWKKERPWGTYWMDMCTRKVMASSIRIQSPNSDIVLCSFGNGVRSYGVPKSVLLDNGKDYKSNDLFSEQDEAVIISNLQRNFQIRTVFAIPYNARAKPIERMFNTFESQFGKKFPSYVGSDTRKRPESLKDIDIMECPTLEEFIELHDEYVYNIYCNSEHSGEGMDGMTPNQAYSSKPFAVRKVSEEVLRLCLMRIKGKRTVQRNGVTFNGEHYYMGEMNINYVGKPVFARYDPSDPDTLHIFDLNDNYLTPAHKVQKQGFDSALVDFKGQGQRRKEARAAATKERPHTTTGGSLQSVKELVRRQAVQAAATAPEEAAPRVIEPIRNAKMEENARRASMPDLDRQYQDALARQQEQERILDERKRRIASLFTEQMLAPYYESKLKEVAK